MAWWGKLIGGALGFMMGGPLGALLGGIAFGPLAERFGLPVVFIVCAGLAAVGWQLASASRRQKPAKDMNREAPDVA